MSRRVLALSGAVIATLLGAGSTTAPAAQAPQMLTRLVVALESEPEAVHADFAAVALSEMIAAYELELDKLSMPGQVSRGEIAKQARWGRALAQFLEELYVARDELDAGAPVELLAAPPAEVQMLIGDRLVAVSSPRIDSPQSIEQRIAEVYCELFVCAPELFDPPEPVPESRANRGGWSFEAGQGSTYETADGLGFMFSDVRNRARKEQLCIRIGEELNRLSMALARARQQGREVDMRSFRLKASGRGDDPLVLLSRSGDTMRVSLPMLVEVPDLVEIARDWVAARSDGKDYRQRFPRAERLLARLLSAPQ